MSHRNIAKEPKQRSLAYAAKKKRMQDHANAKRGYVKRAA